MVAEYVIISRIDVVSLGLMNVTGVLVGTILAPVYNGLYLQKPFSF